MPPALFAVVIFEIASYIYVQSGLDHSPPAYASCPHPAFICEMGSFECFPQATLSEDPPDPFLPSS
jgi:hypothetical protein